ncbi:hypothetical protein DCO44_01350 [Acinetobacter sp. AM]|uniref:ATP-dependent nuclease n=1 Tax=Acinetobacter sp. AM TaxID=2170730 RepID=UPI000DE61389|nr:ATP-binding protein [Acinetobacter sp. AM]PWB16983.1 hypothetical protein DCO44_01350 [Acinetobacter sp. AM]
MQLENCTFFNLKGFGDLHLNDLKRINSLIGPNGSGKSSILQTIKLSFDILKNKKIHDRIPESDPNFLFSKAELCFTAKNSQDFFINSLINGNFKKLSITIECSLDQFKITEIKFDSVIINITNKNNIKEISNLQEQIKQHNQGIINTTKIMSNTISTIEERQKLKNLNSIVETLQNKLNEILNLNITISNVNEDKEITLSYSEFEEILAKIKIPNAIYIPPRQIPETQIKNLIHNLMVLKKGRKNQTKEHDRLIDKLNAFIQAKTDVSDIDGKEDLHVNGITYSKSSSGTEIAIAYFTLTNLIDLNTIILWDEPENSLHPTRRSKLLELMKNDNRQTILATHTTEFSPIFDNYSRIFQCQSTYDEDSDVNKLSITTINTKRDCFQLLEAIGIHPAKILFTANIVIWVEGPTELLFYKHWLENELKDNFIEGFHYTFMQYGGALISYLSLDDDNHTKSVFDLLCLCRNPIVIVDSDFRNAPPLDSNPKDSLKHSAKRIYEEIQKLNTQLPTSALFQFTNGREVENYLPSNAILHAMSKVWSDYSKHEDKFKDHQLTVGQYNSYEDEISNLFSILKILDNKQKPIGRSRWGASNKVEMMRHALSTPNLKNKDLLWDFSSQLEEIVEFIKLRAQL